MKLRLITRLASRALLVLLALGSVAPGCSRQGEGERCDLTANDSLDCDDGLECTPCRRLVEHVVDRCCKPGGASTDPRCALRSVEVECTTGATGTGGRGSAGASGTAGTAGSSSGGTAGVDESAGAGGE
jgi:hypothetical protein